jgi:TatD DNase family protein
LTDWSLYQSFARDYPGLIFYTVGLHPGEVNADWEKQVSQIESFWKSDLPPIALGEVGLDFNFLPENAGGTEAIKTQQTKAFAAQIAIAEMYDCPIVVHSRGAFHDCLALLKKSAIKPERVIFHCFVEDPTTVKQVIDAGMWASFTGILTYKSAQNIREAAKVVGLDRMIIETDAPYLAPVPFRGKTNEPAYVTYVAHAAAEILGVDEIVLREKIWKTTCQAYCLPAN